MYVVLYRVYLIGSTPGRYQGPAMEKWGHLRLRKVMFFVWLHFFFFPSVAIVPLCPRHKNDWCSWKSIVRLQDAFEMISQFLYWGNSDNRQSEVLDWSWQDSETELGEISFHILSEIVTELIHFVNAVLIWMTDSYRADS